MPDLCPICRDERGWIEVLPPDKHAHATVARCPHSAPEILRIKRDTQTERAVIYAQRHPRPQETLFRKHYR